MLSTRVLSSWMACFVPGYSTLLLFCMTKFAIVCLWVCLDDLNSDEGAIVRNMWEYSSTGTFKNIYIYTPSGAMRCISKAKYLLFRIVSEFGIIFFFPFGKDILAISRKKSFIWKRGRNLTRIWALYSKLFFFLTLSIFLKSSFKVPIQELETTWGI